MAAPFVSAPYEEASPTLLAQQPARLDEAQKPSRNWGDIYSHLEQRLGSLRTWRWSWWAHWLPLAEFILPRRHHWFIVPNRTNRGSPINNAIIDSTPTLAMQTCAAGLWTGLTSPSRPWFKLGAAWKHMQLEADAKEWLEDTEERIYKALAESNFYTTMAQAFEDVTTFGTAPVIIYEDFEDVFRCYLPCAGEYFLAVGSRFKVDTHYREFTLTVAQLVDMFRLENCPAEVREQWTTGGASLDTEYVVAHAIEPNFPLAGRSGTKDIQVVPKHFAWREVYWLKGNRTEAPLSRRGFNDSPFMVARWSTVSNDPYGRSPAMDALGDVKQVQQETRRKAEFIDKGVRPPMGADPELKNEPSSILPGNVTYTNTAGGKKGFWPLFEPKPEWLTAITADIKEVNTRIERAFFVDLFMAITRMEGVQPRNELELTKRDLERLQGLGPFITRFETEFAGPAIKRIFSIMQRRRLLKPMPQSLRNVPLGITYVSILKLAQRSAEAVALKDVLTTGAELTEAAQASGARPPLRIINLDEAMREYVELSNANPKILFTEEEVLKHDKARDQAQQAQQGGAAAMSAVEAAKNLGQTSIAPDTALGAVLGRAGVAQPSGAGVPAIA